LAVRILLDALQTVGYGGRMTALMRLRLSGRALRSLGLLMTAVLLGIGSTGWSVQHGSDPARILVAKGSSLVLDPATAAQSPSEHVLTPAVVEPSNPGSTGAVDARLLPHQIRVLVGALLTTGPASGSEPYWLLILGLGLYLSAAADRNRLRRLFGGCRHGTRAPPLRF
jgi:hypothetical protein